MKILVTGGAGYIGSHVLKRLLQDEHEVLTLDNLSKGHRQAVLGGKFIKEDLENKSLLDRLISEFEIEGVVHLAADSRVGESMENPGKYYRNNIANGLNLLESMVENGVKYMVFSSTAAVYGEPQSLPISEEHPTQPTNTYGESKLFFEKMLERYRQVYGLKYVSLRYFNAAGADPEADIGEAHEPETHLIPIVLQKALGKREDLYIFGDDYETRDGSCIRDYVHVNDLADAHILALKGLSQGLNSNIYNLGNGKGYSVKEVIEAARRVTGRKLEAEIAEKRPGDPAVLVASAEKIIDDLGWKPRYPELEKIIETAWLWHRNSNLPFKG